MTSAEAATRTAPTGGGLRVEHPAEGVRALVFDRRECRNPLDIEVLTRLSHELALIRTDSAVRTVILTGANGAFTRAQTSLRSSTFRSGPRLKWPNCWPG